MTKLLFGILTTQKMPKLHWNSELRVEIPNVVLKRSTKADIINNLILLIFSLLYIV